MLATIHRCGGEGNAMLAGGLLGSVGELMAGVVCILWELCKLHGNEKSHHITKHTNHWDIIALKGAIVFI